MSACPAHTALLRLRSRKLCALSSSKGRLKELFDRSKLLGGLLKATQKRPVDAEQIAKEIETELYNSLREEITTEEIGRIAMEKLRAADEGCLRALCVGLPGVQGRGFLPCRTEGSEKGMKSRGKS